MCSHHTLAPAELRREAKVVRKFWVALARLHQILDDLKIALTRSIVQRREAFHVCAIEILVRQLSSDNCPHAKTCVQDTPFPEQKNFSS